MTPGHSDHRFLIVEKSPDVVGLRSGKRTRIGMVSAQWVTEQPK
jgi:hypothetical protein